MLHDKIEADLKAALLARDELKTSTLRFLKAALQNTAIEKRAPKLDDADVCKVLQKQVKQHQESIQGYEKGNRPELAARERAELTVLEGYLPKGLTDQELAGIVAMAIQKTGATSKAHRGTVMKEVMAQAGGRADGKKVSDLVSQKLA